MVVPAPSEPGSVVVVHSVSSWLPLTEGWIYNQLRFAQCPSIVVADSLESHGYDWDPIYTLQLRRELIARRLSGRTGVRTAPRRIVALLKSRGATVLHSHFGDRGWFDRPLARRLGARHVVTFYGYDLSLLPQNETKWRRRYRSLFDEADLFLCEGPFMAQTLVQLGCDPARIKVQRLGVDPTAFPMLPRKLSDDGVVRILIAASFREKKGIPSALEAVANVREKQPAIQVTVIGDSSGEPGDEAEKRRIQEVVAKRRLAPVVRFLGFQPHAQLVEEAYAHHIFLSPSRTARDGDTEGGAPVALTEMSLTGMPIVSTQHCDIPQVVLNGETGLLAREADVEDLTRCLWAMVSRPEQWTAYGVAGRRHVEQNFDARTLGAKLGQVYLHLAGRSAK